MEVRNQPTEDTTRVNIVLRADRSIILELRDRRANVRHQIVLMAHDALAVAGALPAAARAQPRG